jgi:hypothetical protein
MKMLSSVLVIALASAVCLVAQETAPKRKTTPPTETIVEGALIWSREGTAIVKIPRETIRATLADSALVIKSGSTNIPIQIVPAGTKVFIKLREESRTFTILELGQLSTDVTPVVSPSAPQK